MLVPSGARINWVYPGCSFDIDFINQRYYWGGLIRSTSDFTTYSLGGGTFGANGLTPSSTTDITLTTTQTGVTTPGTLAVRCYFTSTASEGIVEISDGTNAEDVRFLQGATNGNISASIRTGSATVTNINLTGNINATRGAGVSYTTNVLTSNDAVTGSTDPTSSVGTLTVIRFCNLSSMDSAMLGALGRVVGFNTNLSQVPLNLLVQTIMQ